MCDLWAMTIRFVMDVACCGLRQRIVKIITQYATELSLSEYGHLVVMHILLPLVSGSALAKSATSIMMQHASHQACSRCACPGVSKLGLDGLVSIACCCKTSMEEAKLAVSMQPALELVVAISSNLDVIAMNKWGRKVLMRFYNLDAKLHVDPVVGEICYALSHPPILRNLVCDRRGVKLIITIVGLISRENGSILRHGLNSLVLEHFDIRNSCLGITSTKLQGSLIAELNITDEQQLPSSVPLSLPAFLSSKKLRDLLISELSSEWQPVCLSVVNMERWSVCAPSV